MATRYEYDLDHNSEWRWIAIANNDGPIAVSPEGYEHLQDCLHAVALMQDPGGFAVLPGIQERHDGDPPEMSLARLHLRP